MSDERTINEKLKSLAGAWKGYLTGATATEALRHIEELEAERSKCEPYLKEGETPAECIQRNRNDAGSVLALLGKEKKKTERLQNEIYKLQMEDSLLEFIERVQNAGLHHEWGDFNALLDASEPPGEQE